ncbi:hypothetical protein PST87_09760 [Yersinia pestis]|nr:hypothetical protein [Yersinia pestis]
MTHQELKVMLLKDPAFRPAYEAESQNPQSGYQIIRHHGDGTEEVILHVCLIPETVNPFTLLQTPLFS